MPQGDHQFTPRPGRDEKNTLREQVRTRVLTRSNTRMINCQYIYIIYFVSVSVKLLGCTRIRPDGCRPARRRFVVYIYIYTCVYTYILTFGTLLLGRD